MPKRIGGRGDRWVKKKQKGPRDPQAARGPTTHRQSTDVPKAPTARGRVAKTETEARQQAVVARREARRARRARKKSRSNR